MRNMLADMQASGREAEQESVQNKALPSPFQFAREIFVPRVMDGTIQYTIMEIVTSGESGNYWTLRHKVQHPQAHMIAATSDTPNPVVITSGVHRAY
ncbi:uncharacterized protein MKZ38_006902 [Zalerion maritima]|uniref:Uncharacterized protein n=1 Tax=Zalerion maritima TaxID=339359 RepID=A0AAD5RID0_9PEZI|nr:uncharacterized protein MKZ38_006902 [Zalerion maritima]